MLCLYPGSGMIWDDGLLHVQATQIVKELVSRLCALCGKLSRNASV